MKQRAVKPPSLRFWAKVNKTDSCWLWTGSLNEHGYGRFQIGRRSDRQGVKAHRWAYEAARGPVPDGLVLDHLCRVRRCVNPDHLEPVTQRENLMRGETRPAAHAASSSCIRGHEWTPENTHHAADGRHCRTCDRDRHARMVTCDDCGREIRADSRSKHRRSSVHLAVSA